MTLKEKLNEMDEKTIVKIGSKNGSAWFYTGEVGAFSVGDLDKSFRAEAERVADGCLDRLRKMAGEFPTKGHVKASDSKWARYSANLGDWGNLFARKVKEAALAERIVEDMKPVLEREVLEVWDADGEDAINILVEGGGTGKKYMAQKMEPLNAEDINGDGIANLVVEIYKPEMDALKRLYIKRHKMKKAKKRMTDEEVSTIHRIENFLKRDVYGISHDPIKPGENAEKSGLVKRCRDAAAEEIRKMEKEAKGNEKLHVPV